MKIALIIEYFDPHGGGAEKSTAQIAKHLASRGHQVVILAWGACVSDGVPGVEVRPCSKRGRVGALALLRFRNWVRGQLATGEFDASLSVTTTVPAAVVQPRSGTLRETFDRNIAMRATEFGRVAKTALLALSPKAQVLLRLERKALADPSVQRFAAVSGYVERQLTQQYGVDPARIEVIPNAADMPVPSEAERQQWRQTVRQGFQVPDDTTLFLFAALNARLKGIGALLDALSRLKERGLPAHLMIVGDASYALQHQATRAGLRDRIRFVGTTNRMAQLYCAADVTVLPTFYDPSSKVVIESLMMGTPAISTAYNGASDFITGNGKGNAVAGRVIADPADAKALADAMAEMLDPAVRQRSAAAATALAPELTMDRHVDRLERLLLAVAAGKHQSGAPV